MIGVNKNIKWDSMIASDWDVLETGYKDANGAHRSFLWGLDASVVLENGGQEGWTFASFTEAEIQSIMNGTGLITLSAGTFPFLGKILVPTITTDANGNNTFTFNNTSICSAFYNTEQSSSMPTAKFRATYSDNNGKMVVDETSVPAGKTNITHLVFVRGREGKKDTGAMTIDPTQFAAFTVGLPGSGAEIIMSDTTIALGKTFLIGSSAETSFKVSFTTSIEVQ